MRNVKKFIDREMYEDYISSLDARFPNVSVCYLEKEVRVNRQISIIHVSSVTLNHASINLYVGSSELLVPTLMPTNATYKDVTWSSSNDSIATVTNQGLVSGVSSGSAVITVTTTDGGLTAQCSVSVSNVVVTSITIDKVSISLSGGQVEQLVATVSPNNATDKSVTWTSSDNSIATVTSQGLVSGVSDGDATITATANGGNGVSSTCQVSVIGYEKRYLTFDVLTNGTIKWNRVGSANKTIQYSINNGEWVSMPTGTTISVSEGDKVRFKGSNTKYATDKNNHCVFSGGTASFNIEGNIMSLVYGDNFVNNTSLTETYTFCCIFKDSQAVSAENLVLPATTLSAYCYRGMFSLCSTLTKAPKLPATTLAQGCYYYMFEKCGITEAPELNANKLVSQCYFNMFNSCSSLNYIKCLANESLSVASGLTNWVSGVSSSGTFVKHESATWVTGNSGIPTNWVIFNGDVLSSPSISCDGEYVTITCDNPNADIYYKLNQSGGYTLYSSPIEITADTIVEAYSKLGTNQSSTISKECTYIPHVYKFGDLQLASGPLYYGNNGYEIKDSWNYDSYNTVYGKNVGSYYFNFIEMGELFESNSFTAADGDIVNSLNTLSDYRLPTTSEWQCILGTTRDGSSVNGSPNKHYAMVQLANVSHASTTSPIGVLLFPDDETITGTTLDYLDTETLNTNISEQELNAYIEQGCAFLCASGRYDNGFRNGGTNGYFLSSSEYDTVNAYYVTFSGGSIVSNSYVNKTNVYTQVILVKNETYSETPLNGTTKSVDNWTYNNALVDLPYSVNAIDGHSSNYSKGTFTFNTTIDVKKVQNTYLWFDHADQSADVYVNNTLASTHWGGYNAFFVDVTNNIHSGNNDVRVTLCNTTRDTLAPCAGDFNFNATLGCVKVISSLVYPSAEYGYDGFHISANVSSASATLNVKTHIPNEADVVFYIDDGNYYYSEKRCSVSGDITFTKVIQNPHLWNGTLDPHLYDITLEIYYNGDLYHRFTRPYGFRYYDYVINDTSVLPNNDPYTGFLLNGQPYLLRGVCMHHDLKDKANALTSQDIDNEFAIIQELGCNFIRLAHYPHTKEVYDWCDRLGIVVQTEVPWVNNARSTQPSDYYTHLEGQYTDMINQHYNHPCIMFWGLSNETTTDDKAFAKEKVEGYRTLIKSLDQERWVGYVVSHNVTNPSSHFNNPNMDWFGCNIYVGWYINAGSNDPTTNLNTRLNSTVTSLSKPLAFSEYGAGGTQSCHSDDFLNTTNSGSSSPRHDIEYQMWLHEGHIAAIRNFPQLLFTSQWQLFDIAVSNRNEGYTVCLDGENTSVNDNLRRLNDKGLVERDHVTKKDTFYIYKAEWSSEKFVHICGKDYTKMSDRVIKCYSNDGTSFSLYVNGQLAQTATSTNNIVTFTAMNFSVGDIVSVSGATSVDAFTFGYDEYDYVEIGGLKWATRNVGASAETDGGLYFSWGDVRGYSASEIGSGQNQKYFGWEDYKYNSGGSSPSASDMTKYNETDGKVSLDLSDDAARFNMGGKWRMPTSADFEALISSTTSHFDGNYQSTGIKGTIFTDKIDNSKKLFFPYVGYADQGVIHLKDNNNRDVTDEWASDIYTSDKTRAFLLAFATSTNLVYNRSRYNGFSVRGVMDI